SSPSLPSPTLFRSVLTDRPATLSERFSPCACWCPKHGLGKTMGIPKTTFKRIRHDLETKHYVDKGTERGSGSALGAHALSPYRPRSAPRRRCASASCASSRSTQVLDVLYGVLHVPVDGVLAGLERGAEGV